MMKTYMTPTTITMPMTTLPTLLAGSPDGMPTFVSDTDVTFDHPGGSFTSEEEVASKKFFSLWDEEW